MLGKRSQHLIRKFSELLVFGGDGSATALLDTIGSPRSPFDMKSPKGLNKTFEFGGGVGLGIVVALEEAAGYEVVPKHVCTLKRCTCLNRSSGVVPIIPIQNHQKIGFEEEEDYTFVTYHQPNGAFSTKVYYDGGEAEFLRHDVLNNNTKNNNVGVFRKTSTTTPISQTLVKSVPSYYPTSDFLSSCHLCRKKLDGQDIYMYRGEKAFCSTECRSRQILMDERKEKCRSEASSRSVKMSTSPYTRDQMFSTGIVAL